MILYHGTSEKVAFESLARGLYGVDVAITLRNGSRNQGRAALTLTDIYAGHMAHAAVQDRGKWGIVEIDTDRLNQVKLMPTPDALEFAFRDTERVTQGKDPGTPERAIVDALTGLDTEKRRQWFKERLGQFHGNWLASVSFSGFCLYDGHIPPKAIKRISMVGPQNPICHLATTPIGDPASHVKNRDRHAVITAWLMGAELDASVFAEVGIDPADMVGMSESLERRVLNNR